MLHFVERWGKTDFFSKIFVDKMEKYDIL